MWHPSSLLSITLPPDGIDLQAGLLSREPPEDLSGLGLLLLQTSVFINVQFLSKLCLEQLSDHFVPSSNQRHT